MRILAVASHLATAFEQLGHEVLRVWQPGEAVLNVPRLLDETGFAPDLVFQQEALDRRVLLAGLESLDCPRIFWSIDTHLNLPWHRYYARLFDGVMTPHMSILRDAHVPMPPARRLAWPGSARPWRPFAQRGGDVAFVGRLENRPVRRWLLEFLRERYPAPHVLRTADDLTGAQMMQLYADTRLVPNESILGEVNFRLVEAASAGCLVLSPDIGEDQDVQFSSGAEIEIYSNALHMGELMDRHLREPDRAEAMARAAWERVQREHLPEHRAAAVLEFARQLSGGAAEGADAERALRLTLLEMDNFGMTTFDPAPTAARLAAMPPTAESTATLMRHAVAKNDRAMLAAMVDPTLVHDAHRDDLEVNLAGCMAGLVTGDWDMAKQFWYRQQRHAQVDRPLKPESPRDLCLAWARELTRAGRVFAFGGGRGFEPGKKIPRSAVECLEYARTLAPEDCEVLRRVEAALSSRGGLEYMRLGRLSPLTVREPENWRAELAMGMVDLKIFRPREGLVELAVARGMARAQGKEAAFERTLRGMDPSGCALRALAHADGPAAHATNDTGQNSSTD